MIWNRNNNYSPLGLSKDKDEEYLQFDNSSKSTIPQKEHQAHQNQKRQAKKSIKAEVDYESEVLLAPWMSLETANSKNPNVKFHNEMVEFVKLVEPSKEMLENVGAAFEE